MREAQKNFFQKNNTLCQDFLSNFRKSKSGLFPSSITFCAFFSNFSKASSLFADPICTVFTTSPPCFQQTWTPVAPLPVLNLRINAITTLSTFPPKSAKDFAFVYLFISHHLTQHPVCAKIELPTSNRLGRTNVRCTHSRKHFQLFVNVSREIFVIFMDFFM